ncbi:ABC transporter permease [Granulicella sibirica]|uniref:Hydroxymethylpyrimidine ABC transporter, transmembrane component n=1 Tax=Granulicella sibirica TaxID=2479048 RepID=A0A4Q0T6K3_9BACT|nr:ABC transporter permease subunit [Granulicella sibirica]RXH58280.1 Hydroxymethylpyrimidine ABC transporter, transmembrane component [Granulicella sibirica]
MIGRLFRKSWAVLLLLALWQAWVMTTNYNRIVVVSPFSVLQDIALHAPVYLGPALWTLGFAVGGLALGMIAGVALAVVCWTSKLLTGLLQPAALLLTATPIVCLIPLLARIFGYESRTELLTVMIMTFFPSFVYAGSGLNRLPRRSLEFFHTLQASRLKRLTLLALPAAIPELAVALRVGSAYSILVTVVAEFLMQTGGLGAMFAVTMQMFNLHRAMGASVIAMVLSTALYEASTALEAKVKMRFAE